MDDRFDAGLGFRRLRGPFGVAIVISDDFVELAPTGVFGLLRGLPIFRSAQVPREDVIAIDRDSPRRAGLRVRTRSGALDRFVVVPDSAAQRRAIHSSFEAHGYRLA